MKDLRYLAKIFLNLIGAVLGVIVVVFAGMLIYDSNPSLMMEGENQEVGAVTGEWQPKNPEIAYQAGEMPEDVEYGFLLISQTPKYMGPQAEDPSMRYAGNNLTCVNCHLENATKVGSATWIGVNLRYPSFSGRINGQRSLKDRVNGCMERSMDGKKLPDDSKMMHAIIAYINWLSEGMPEEREKEFEGYKVPWEMPQVAVDLSAGKKIFEKECMVCHQKDGQGVKSPNSAKEYLYPPLWGEDSFNTGAGMHRVITAAQFIQANMPFGQATWDNPKLSDIEAYNVAGYINSFNRPIKDNFRADYPVRKMKPISQAYPPWADPFSAEQHAFGPFPPIVKYYKETYGMVKKK